MGGTSNLTQEDLERLQREQAAAAAQQEQGQQEGAPAQEPVTPPKTPVEAIQQGVDKQVAAIKGAAGAFKEGMNSATSDYIEKEGNRATDIVNRGKVRKEETEKLYGEIFGENGVLTQAYKKRQQELEDAEKEDKQRSKTDYNTARWTGITEFASALLNLGMVVGAGANSITVPEYSKDWMKKADADRKERKQRIDRMRDNITAQQERLAQGRLAGMLAANREQYTAEDKADSVRGDANKVGLGAQQQILNNEYQSAGAIAGAEATGSHAKANIMQHDKDRAITAAQHAAAMRARGYNPNGTVNEGYMKTLRKFSDVSPRNPSARGEKYRIARKDGSEGFVRMSKETRKRALLGAGEELKRDIMRDAGFNGSWEDFVESASSKKVRDENGKKVSNPLYGKYDDIIAGLSSVGDERYEAIEDYLDKHPDSWEVGELLARYSGVSDDDDEADDEDYAKFK